MTVTLPMSTPIYRDTHALAATHQGIELAYLSCRRQSWIRVLLDPSLGSGAGLRLDDGGFGVGA
jgi:hypothetical protein